MKYSHRFGVVTETSRSVRRAMACDGKSTYVTFAEANGVARRMRHRTERKHAFPYRCPWCRRWHLGVAKPRRARLAEDEKRRERSEELELV